jgi:TolB-like protein/Flp pilus assembly protein TadD
LIILRGICLSAYSLRTDTPPTSSWSRIVLTHARADRPRMDTVHTQSKSLVLERRLLPTLLRSRHGSSHGTSIPGKCVPAAIPDTPRRLDSAESQSRRAPGRELRARCPRRILSAISKIVWERGMSGEAPESGTGPAPTNPPAAVQVPNASIHVFISYASQDAAVAGALVEALERHGVGCWIAPRDVRAGALYADAIIRAISGAKAIALVLSESAVASSHVSREIERASSKKRPIIALRIDAAPLTPALEYFLSESQWIEAQTGRMETAYAKLIDAIREPAPLVAVGPGTPAGTAAVARPKLRFHWILLAAGTVFIVAALAALVDKFWISSHVAQERPVATTSLAPAAGAPAQPTITEKSIAVLPFVDMSEKKDQEYFSDGLSEELIDRLTHSADLRVISRTSSFYFKGKQATIGDIAKTLGVSHVLEGSVRKAGRKLRITAQLIRASDGSHLWSQTYDRSLADVFKVQDEIAGTVAQALKVALRTGTAGRTEANQEAYSLVLKGNYFWYRGNEADDDKALELYTEATRLDPNYALAWAKVARATDKNSSESLAKALEAAQRSLRIDPSLAYAHYVLGRTHMYFEWDWAAAKAELERAIELDPDDLHARVDLAYLTEGIFGQFDRKVRYLRQIVSSDPLDAESLEHLAVSLFLAGRFDEAGAVYRELLQLYPAEEGANAGYGVVLLLLHQPREALAAIEKETDEPSKLWGLAILDWEIGHRAESDAAVSRLEGKYASTRYVSYIAEVRAYRGEVDAAFKWLDRAYQRSKLFMTLMPVDPLLRNLQSDSRFEGMLARLKLDEWKRKVFANRA